MKYQSHCIWMVDIVKKAHVFAAENYYFLTNLNFIAFSLITREDVSKIGAV